MARRGAEKHRAILMRVTASELRPITNESISSTIKRPPLGENPAGSPQRINRQRPL